jgi:glycosyltransferase involved in cell wall biosynthesis
MNDVELRVLQVLPGLSIGGAQEVVRTLVKHMASDGCMTGVCSLFGGGPLFDDLVEQGTQVVEVLSVPRHRFLAFPWYVADMIRLWRALARVITDHRINVVQTHNLGSQHFLVLALAHAVGVPVVILTFQNDEFLPIKQGASTMNLVYRLAYRLARRWASDYVAVSEQVKQTMIRLLGLSEEDITVVCNTVDVDRYRHRVDGAQVRHRLGLDPESKLLITVGTLKNQKGHRYLIEAAVGVVQQHPNAHFLFVGDGELRQDLQAQTTACGLSDKIHFLGSRRDVPDLLAASDVFVLPSLWEGLSVALLEAMAAAKPIVATAVSGTSQAIVHNETGILIPPGDAAALARAIDELLSNPARAQELGETAQRRVEVSFGAGKLAREYLALYRRLLKSGSRQAESAKVWKRAV